MAERMTAAEISAEIERRENSPSLEQLKAAQAFHEFVLSNPSFYDCSENVDTLLTWMRKYAILPSLEHYEQAFAACQAAGLLITEGESEDAPPEPQLNLADIEKLSADDYRRRMLREPGFAEKVEALLSAHPQKRIAAGGHAGMGHADRVSR